MYVCFFKGGTGIWNRLIRWWTKSIYSHCEFCFSDNVSFAADYDVNRTRFKQVTYCQQDWDLFEVNIKPQEEATLRFWCEREKDCKYDTIGILFTQIIPLSFENPWWWFCSEICVAGFKRIGEFVGVKPHECSPQDFYKLFHESDRVKATWSNTL